MELKVVNNIAIVKSDKIIIEDTPSAIGFTMSIKSETGCGRIILNKTAITENFFVLSTGLAGEILQKFVNYGIKFAILVIFPNTQVSHFTILFMNVIAVRTYSS